MKYSFKLFKFQGAPVYLSIWFFLLFVLFSVPTTIGIFISVLLHEMGHAWVANKKGYSVSSISIDIFSGSAATDSNMHDRDSIPIVLAGPMVNLSLALISFICELIYPNSFIHSMFLINSILFIFNILPIYPMDGGQISRSIANLSKNRYKSRKMVAIISLIFSVLLVAYGITFWMIFIAIFGGYFTYISFKELKRYM